MFKNYGFESSFVYERCNLFVPGFKKRNEDTSEKEYKSMEKKEINVELFPYQYKSNKHNGSCLIESRHIMINFCLHVSLAICRATFLRNLDPANIITDNLSFILGQICVFISLFVVLSSCLVCKASKPRP